MSGSALRRRAMARFSASSQRARGRGGAAARLAGVVSQVLRSVRRPGPLVAISLAYLVAAAGIMIWRGISVSPDYLLFLLIPVALLSGRFIGFLRDWVPFVVIFLGWEAMRGIASKTGLRATRVRPRVTGDRPVRRPPAHRGAAADAQRRHARPRPRRMRRRWCTSATSSSRSPSAWCCGSSTACSSCASPPRSWAWRWWRSSSSCWCRPRRPGTRRHTACSAASRRSSAPRCRARCRRTTRTSTPTRWRRSRRCTRRSPSSASWRCAASTRAARGSRSCGASLVWFSVVFLGEHYVVDVIGGVVLAALSWLVMMRVAVPRIGVLQHRAAGRGRMRRRRWLPELPRGPVAPPRCTRTRAPATAWSPRRELVRAAAGAGLQRGVRHRPRRHPRPRRGHRRRRVAGCRRGARRGGDLRLPAGDAHRRAVPRQADPHAHVGRRTPSTPSTTRAAWRSSPTRSCRRTSPRCRSAGSTASSSAHRRRHRAAPHRPGAPGHLEAARRVLRRAPRPARRRGGRGRQPLRRRRHRPGGDGLRGQPAPPGCAPRWRRARRRRATGDAAAAARACGRASPSSSAR